MITTSPASPVPVRTRSRNAKNGRKKGGTVRLSDSGFIDDDELTDNEVAIYHAHCSDCFSTLTCNSAIKSSGPFRCPIIDCPNRPHCPFRFHACKLNEHLSHICSRTVVSCLNALYGCPITLTRDRISAHLRVCPASVVHCSFKWVRKLLTGYNDVAKQIPASPFLKNSGTKNLVLSDSPGKAIAISKRLCDDEMDSSHVNYIHQDTWDGFRRITCSHCQPKTTSQNEIHEFSHNGEPNKINPLSVSKMNLVIKDDLEEKKMDSPPVQTNGNLLIPLSQSNYDSNDVIPLDLALLLRDQRKYLKGNPNFLNHRLCLNPVTKIQQAEHSPLRTSDTAEEVLPHLNSEANLKFSRYKPSPWIGSALGPPFSSDTLTPRDNSASTKYSLRYQPYITKIMNCDNDGNNVKHKPYYDHKRSLSLYDYLMLKRSQAKTRVLFNSSRLPRPRSYPLSHENEIYSLNYAPISEIENILNPCSQNVSERINKEPITKFYQNRYNSFFPLKQEVKSTISSSPPPVLKKKPSISILLPSKILDRILKCRKICVDTRLNLLKNNESYDSILAKAENVDQIFPCNALLLSSTSKNSSSGYAQLFEPPTNRTPYNDGNALSSPAVKCNSNWDRDNDHLSNSSDPIISANDLELHDDSSHITYSTSCESAGKIAFSNSFNHHPRDDDNTSSNSPSSVTRDVQSPNSSQHGPVIYEKRIHSFARYTFDAGSVHYFACGQYIRRDAFPWHYLNVHAQIESYMEDWLFHSCPLSTPPFDSNINNTGRKHCDFVATRLLPLSGTLKSLTPVSGYAFKTGFEDNRKAGELVFDRIANAISFKPYSFPRLENNDDPIRSPFMTSLGDLPTEAICEICMNLEPLYLLNFSLVNKRFYELVRSLILPVKGMVLTKWGKTGSSPIRWEITDKKWVFPKTFAPITGWQFNPNCTAGQISNHLKKCPSYEINIPKRPFRYPIVDPNWQQDAVMAFKNLQISKPKSRRRDYRAYFMNYYSKYK
ncbi:unnamed protein product [Gordionus sp. m RMFG-2023]